MTKILYSSPFHQKKTNKNCRKNIKGRRYSQGIKLYAYIKIKLIKGEV